jgi:anti-anti-sigma factor
MSVPHQQRSSPEAVEALPGDAVAAALEPFVQTFEPIPDFHVEALSSDCVHRVVLHGELDLVGAPVLLNRVRELCAQPTQAVRLDLRRLSFMDSSGLHAVLDVRELCARNDWGFGIVGGSPAVRRLFEVSGLGSLLAPQRP